MLRTVASYCCNWGESVTEEVNDGGENQHQPLLNSQSTVVHYQTITTNVDQVEAALTLDSAQANNQTLAPSCHQRVVSFFSRCVSGGRNCLSYVFEPKPICSFRYAVSPASLISIGICAFLGADMLKTKAEVDASEYLNFERSFPPIIAGSMLGALVGFVFVGPLLYQLTVGSWGGICPGNRLEEG